ncbi:hypothetical protein M9H77_03152 [Catharanthus roseus]|uniref:Uncharacterized protein n=1 Tax=Catharanthus roseus TaxID=4058 RepID=A0ACC0CAL2_CATRO|nr:hypothetical protein M9H77_03152 [Catharanthus roseus]
MWKRQSVNVIIMYGMNSYQREYEEYHEGYDHGAHTHDKYNFGAYVRNDYIERWRYLRSMHTFYGEAMEVNQWLKVGMDLRTNPFKRGADGVTRDVQEIVELSQGPVTKAMARRMEEEHRRKIAIFEKMIQDLAWQVIGAQGGAFRRTKILLFPSCKWRKPKKQEYNSYIIVHCSIMRTGNSSTSKDIYFRDILVWGLRDISSEEVLKLSKIEVVSEVFVFFIFGCRS